MKIQRSRYSIYASIKSKSLQYIKFRLPQNFQLQ